jgi:hypothetical protein
MPLYVANLSRNVLEFTYRVAGENRYFTTKILPFAQESIYSRGTPDELASIVDQNKPYGLVAVSDIDRTKAFIGMCYQFDKPIQPDKMIPVARHNDDVLTRDAQESRKITAIAMDNALARSAQETGLKFNGVEVELEEQEQKGSDTQINETIAVEGQGRSRRQRGGRGR